MEIVLDPAVVPGLWRVEVGDPATYFGSALKKCSTRFLRRFSVISQI